MAKKRNAQEDALREAYNTPERKWFVNRRMAWVNRKTWGFFINWKGVSFNCGTPKNKFHGWQVPEAQFTLSFDWKPFAIIVFWHRKRVLWIGDREWKKSLRNG